MNVSLVMFKADGTRRDFPLTKDRVVIGRTNDCDLRIPLSSVSRQHCEIRVEKREVKLRDMGSSNGTYHNHSRVPETEISAGDLIRIGPVVFTVVIDGQPTQIKPARTILQPPPLEAPPPVPPDSQEGPDSPTTIGGNGKLPLTVEPEANAPTSDLNES